jgi:hypothetical protein
MTTMQEELKKAKEAAEKLREALKKAKRAARRKRPQHASGY